MLKMYLDIAAESLSAKSWFLDKRGCARQMPLPTDATFDDGDND